MGRKIQMTCAASGLLMIALYGCGVAAFARMIPVHSPTDSAAEVVGAYLEHLTGVRVGMSMVMLGCSLMITWGAALATQTRRASPRYPILFHIQIASAVTACMNGVMLCLAGGLAAFRPGAVSAEITQALDDLFWLLWVLPGSSFEVWCIAAGVAILLDSRDRPVFPRWSGYLSIFVALSFLPGFMGLFFKSGPFSYNGVVPWWIPTLTFFSWALVMTPLTIKAISGDPEMDLDRTLDPAVAAEFGRLRAEIAAARDAAGISG
ncbi:MAG TPA: hypothetical protein VL595_28895 [Pseudonocardia sp.]|jgi:hypothetical protein|nr:hypothetical protein [Pseudonocardia sp.]